MKLEKRKIPRVRSHRAKWRAGLFKNGAKPAFSEMEYRVLVDTHKRTLDKYTGQFGRWLARWASAKTENYKKAKEILGPDRLGLILSENTSKHLTINEALALFQALDLRSEFVGYLVNKTHLSFSLAPGQIIQPMSDRAAKDPYYFKLAEFVFIILCEYVVLHNYMFVSGLRPDDLESIDHFMKPMSYVPPERRIVIKPKSPRRSK